MILTYSPFQDNVRGEEARGMARTQTTGSEARTKEARLYPSYRGSNLWRPSAGLVPQQEQSGCDHDSRTGEKPNARYVPPGNEADDESPYQQEIIERLYFHSHPVGLERIDGEIKAGKSQAQED